MKCNNCPVWLDCRDPAQNSGGCDMDGVDDFGCDSNPDEEDCPDEDDWMLPTKNN